MKLADSGFHNRADGKLLSQSAASLLRHVIFIYVT